MFYKRVRSKKYAGFNIVEIVVAMALLMVAMMALAFVYPSARRMTDSSKLSTQATEIARSIMEEIKARPIYSTSNPNGLADIGILSNSFDNPSGAATNNLDTDTNPNHSIRYFNHESMKNFHWPYHHLATIGDIKEDPTWEANCPVYCWGETNITGDSATWVTFKSNTLDPVGKIFFLPTAQIPYRGITIPRGIVIQTPTADRNPRLISVSVTVCWIEEIAGAHLTLQHVTLTSLITDNKYQ